MIELRNHQVVVWRLLPEGRCGVGDHSRLLVQQLGGRIVDVAEGMVPEDGPQLIQYTPNGWTEREAWVGPLVRWLRAHPTAERTLFLHEVRRRLTPDPRTAWPFVHDLLALRLLLPLCHRVLVTTEQRAHSVGRMLRAWGLDIPLHVVAVGSNVHDADPVVEPVVESARDPDALVLFARSSAGVLGSALAQVVAAVVRRRPQTRVTLLGDRGFARQDDLVGTLQELGVADQVRITGMLPAAQVAEELLRGSVGLALHDTGASGRRGTMGAMLASGVPIVSGIGEETDGWLKETPAVVLASDTRRLDVNAVADAVLLLLDEDGERRLARREAAVRTYLEHCSWHALAAAVGQRATVRPGAEETRRSRPWVA